MNCIHSLLTLEHISLMCQDKGVHRLPVKTAFRKDSECSYDCCPDNSFYFKVNQSLRIQHMPFRFDPISILALCQQTELLFSMFIEGKGKCYPYQRNSNKANEILMENIQQHMQCIHDQELNISQEESEQFTLHVIKRHKNKAPSYCPISENFNKSTIAPTNPQWRCFIKGISVTHVILTFVPATLQDLKHLVNFDCCCYPALNYNESDNERTSSRGSSCSDVPINSSNSLILPVYVYDCPLSLLVDAYVNGGQTVEMQSKDVYEDHRYKSEQINQEESVK